MMNFIGNVSTYHQCWDVCETYYNISPVQTTIADFVENMQKIEEEFGTLKYQGGLLPFYFHWTPRWTWIGYSESSFLQVFFASQEDAMLFRMKYC